MTGVPVTDVGMMNKIPYANEAGGTPAQANGSDFMGKFKSAMETQATAMNIAPAQAQVTDIAPAQSTRPERPVSDVSKSAKADTDRRSVRSEVKKEAKAGKGSDTAKDAETVAPETVEAVAEAAGRVVNEVAAELNVEPEEVFGAMEELGLTMTDMLDPANMTDLVATISGEQDTLSLLTDENLYQTLENLKGFVADETTDLIDKLDLSQEALDEVLEQTEALLEQPYGNDSEPDATSVRKDIPLEGMKDHKVTATIDGEQVTMDVRVDDATGAETVAAVRTDGSHESDSRQPSQDREGRGDDDNRPEEPLLTQTAQFNTEINIQDFTAAADEVTSFRTEASDIANQIMDNMRANITRDVTELEMNLHPASLGNVRVSLQAQNGQVTAQFLAQNETVRAAIESQVAQLKESLEAQGIKIEQVEVAVASQGFDRNRDNSQGQSGDGNRGQAGHGVSRAGRVRRLDLNAMDGEELEDMEDADRIAAEMMAHDGNTVDYMA